MRPTWEAYALHLAEAAACRAEDPQYQVGAVAIRYDNSVASVGYNGTIPGLNFDWSDVVHKRPRVIHAEQNALKYCKPGEVKFLAVNVMPCSACLVTIASYRIAKVVYSRPYKDEKLVQQIAAEFGIELCEYMAVPNSSLYIPKFDVVSELDRTERGERGLGSTGK